MRTGTDGHRWIGKAIENGALHTWGKGYTEWGGWNRLIGLWTAFEPIAQAMGEQDHGTGETRKRWLLPLLQELDFNEITHPDDIEPNATLFAEMMEGRRSRFSIDKRMYRKNGDPIWVRVTVSALEEEDASSLVAKP